MCQLRRTFAVTRREPSTETNRETPVTTTPIPDAEAHADEARKSFQEQLDELRVDVIRLAALTTEQIAGGTQALVARQSLA